VPLTARQLEILILYADGLRRQEIATRLYLSPRSVESHLQEIRRRLETRSVAHSIVVALSREMLVLDVEHESAALPQDLVAA
jgi:LuxR family maltose regulon positive regulatory protein